MNPTVHKIVFGGLENVHFRPSIIHGLGSMATRTILQDEAIIMPFQPEMELACINHSDSPNCARSLARATPFALRDIQLGEEITEDYRLLPLFGQECDLSLTSELASTQSVFPT